MTLNEKINSLMLLTNSTNARLAKVLHIDASLVSRWRNGTRSPLKNPPLVKGMAEYFAAKLTTSYQVSMAEQLLAQDLGHAGSEETMAEQLENWLYSDFFFSAHDFLEFGKGREGVAAAEAETARPPARPENGLVGGVGQEGRVHALRALLEQWCAGGSRDGELLIYCDEDAEWIDLVTHFVTEYFDKRPDLTSQFHNVRLIIPNTLGPREVMGSIRFIVPFLHSGTFQIYSYPRSNREAFSCFLAVMQGVGAITANSYFGSDPVTVFHREGPFVAHLHQKISELAANSVPLLQRKDRFTFADSLQMRMDFLEHPEDMIFMGNITLPSLLPFEGLNELISMFVSSFENAERVWDRARTYLDCFEGYLDNYKCLICMPLYPPREVEAGAAALAGVPRFFGNRPVITPRRYLGILKRTLVLMERYPNFKFQVMPELQRDYSCGIKPSHAMYMETHTPDPLCYYTQWPIVLRAEYHVVLSGYENVDETARTRAENERKVREHVKLYEEYLAQQP